MPHPSIIAETYPHKPAFIMGNSGEIVTYRQLDERSNQAAQLFRSLGLKAGDHIVCSWNPYCGHCFYCDEGQTILCEARTSADGKRTGTQRQVEGTVRR